MNGYIHSFQSLGTVDGPGVRFVVFFQGCPLRCGCCHNPDTWTMTDGNSYTAEAVAQRVLRFREYFGADGGVTASGGEPLMQPRFLRELFLQCRENGVHTCLDTSGALLNDEVVAALEVTDRVLLDIKYTTEELYQRHVGCSLSVVLDFLRVLEERCIPVTVRQVIVPTLNDTRDHVHALMRLVQPFTCVDGIEFLPFRKLCQSKYDQLGMDFPFASVPEADAALMRRVEVWKAEFV